MPATPQRVIRLRRAAAVVADAELHAPQYAARRVSQIHRAIYLFLFMISLLLYSLVDALDDCHRLMASFTRGRVMGMQPDAGGVADGHDDSLVA